MAFRPAVSAGELLVDRSADGGADGGADAGAAGGYGVQATTDVAVRITAVVRHRIARKRRIRPSIHLVFASNGRVEGIGLICRFTRACHLRAVSTCLVVGSMSTRRSPENRKVFNASNSLVCGAVLQVLWQVVRKRTRTRGDPPDCSNRACPRNPAVEQGSQREASRLCTSRDGRTTPFIRTGASTSTVDYFL